MVVGRLLSYGEGNFLGEKLNFGKVHPHSGSVHIHHLHNGAISEVNGLKDDLLERLEGGVGPCDHQLWGDF